MEACVPADSVSAFRVRCRVIFVLSRGFAGVICGDYVLEEFHLGWERGIWISGGLLRGRREGEGRVRRVDGRG